MSLFGKLWRIKKVLQMRRGQTILVEHTIWPLGRVVVLCDIIILILWTIIEPPKYYMYGLTISMVQKRSVHVIFFNCHSEHPF